MSVPPASANRAVIDLAAIRANARTLRETAGVALIAVVKADGYGHGMAQAAAAAREGGAEWIATATATEARQLRAAGDRGPLLCWLATPGEDYRSVLAEDVEVAAYSAAQLDEVANAADAIGMPARVQLKVDTGLNRGGMPEAEWDATFAHAHRLERQGRVQVTGLWSHFACADEPDHPANAAQEAAFERALGQARTAGLRPALVHLANSAATLLRPSARYSAVRCGIALYGLNPAPGHADDIPLRPAMTLRSRLAMVKDGEPGSGVSYGHLWAVEQPTTLGLVPLGYGDGIPRHASGPPLHSDDSAAQVSVDDVRRPIRGRVCMDQFVVDLLGDRPPAGTEVVVFGQPELGPTAQDWAEACGTINYEIVTRIGGRVPRTYIDTDADGENS